MTSKKLIAMRKKYFDRSPIGWFLVFLILFIVGIGVFEARHFNTFYPGVMIAGEKVGGKTYGQVQEEFKVKYENLQKNGLELVFQKETETTQLHIPMVTSGLTSDISVEYFSLQELEPQLQQAFQWGHQGSVAKRLQEQLALLWGKNFNPPIEGHKEAIQSLITRETKNMFTAAMPAYFSFDKKGKIIIIPEKPGDNLDTQKVTDAVLEKFMAFEFEPLVFKVQAQVPNTTQEKLKPFMAFAKEFADKAGVTFRYRKRHWKVGGRTLATWLTLTPADKISIDDKKLETFLATSVAPFIDNPPVNSRFEVRGGTLIETSPGRPGNVVNISKTAEAIGKIIPQVQESFAVKKNFAEALDAVVARDPNLAFDFKNSVISIPIETVTVEPQITQKTIDQYHIQDLMGTARTNFAGGSLDRQHNIEVGIEKITGYLIAPGQEFSTVAAIGEITEEAGFVKEYVIKEDQTVKELGGGLCQLATTLFRMALKAGLPISERANHKYVIPYYGPGLDATIYGPHPDFRFINDTGNYLLLQGTAKNNEAIFELYGTADGRKAIVGTPVLSNEKPVPEPRNILSSELAAGQVTCTKITHTGVTADTDYNVWYPDGSTKKTIFHSVYVPWPQICLVGTATP